MATIEKLADALQPSVKQALAPIGQSVESINLRRDCDSAAVVILDRETKELANIDKNNTITEARAFSGVISELDMMTGSCKVALESDLTSRISAKIVDPEVRLPNNPYVTALSKLSIISFTAKAEVDEEGNIVNLYISDYHR